jgi:hypothetical protein
MSHLSRGIFAPYPVAPTAHPGFVAGLTYLLSPTMASAAGAVGAIDLVYLWMWQPPAAGVAKSFGVRVATGGAGSSMKIGIWANNPATMRATGVPLRANNTGTVTTANSTTALLTVADWTIAPGVPVWIGAKFTGTLPSIVLTGNLGGEGARLYGTGAANTAGAHAVGFTAPDTYSNNISALDLTSATFTAVTGTAGVPAFYMGT